MATNVIPTKGNLIGLKRSLARAKLGFELLDRKRNVLMREMMKLIDESAQLQQDIGDTFSSAYRALQSANVTLGIEQLMIGVDPEEDGLSISSRGVMGVELPTTAQKEHTLKPLYSFGNTNSQLDRAYLSFSKVKLMTARLASIDNSVYRLAVAIKKTQRRANMLENINIPKFEENIRFISGVLEEREREEFTRLKVIKKTKKS